MLSADVRQIREDSCLLKGSMGLSWAVPVQHVSDGSEDGEWFDGAPEEDWSQAQEVSHSAKSSTKPMSKFVGACFRSQ